MDRGDTMSFQIKDNKTRIKHVYKTLYISELLAEQIEKIAFRNNTSFNNVVISMIEHCLNEDLP